MIICSETTIDKIYNGNIVVEQSSLIITGVVNGDITINPNATVYIRGVVNGTINNYGHLELYGVVDNVNNHSDHFTIHKNAIINDKKY